MMVAKLIRFIESLTEKIDAYNKKPKWKHYYYLSYYYEDWKDSPILEPIFVVRGACIQTTLPCSVLGVINTVKEDLKKKEKSVKNINAICWGEITKEEFYEYEGSLNI